MNLAKHLLRISKARPHAPAIFFGEDLYCNYKELAQSAASLANFLNTQWKLQPNERVALCVKNCPQYIQVLYACWWAGLTVVPINAKLHPQEVKFIIENSNCSAAFLDPEFIPPIHAELPHLEHKTLRPDSEELKNDFGRAPLPLVDVTNDDLAWLFYTSGTTGKPKGVMLSHGNLQAMTACYFTDVDTVEVTNTSLYAAPMSHGAGFYILPHILRGAKHVVPQSGGFDPGELLELANHHREISLFAAPTMIKRLVDYVEALKTKPKQAIDGIKTIVYGGGPMYAQDLQRALDTIGNRFAQIYGQGESPMTITSLRKEYIEQMNHPRWLDRISSVGLAQSLVDVKVVDQSGHDLPTGETGEIIVKGPTVMQGYWNNPKSTANTLKNGWLWTGDIGALDADGFLTLKDRSKDLIISGGTNIYPREVEETLLEHPEVSEVSVIGAPDAEWGEIVVAVVTPKNSEILSNTKKQNSLANELDQLCLNKIARFKRPKTYLWLQELPKNNYGKVLKTSLRELWATRSEL